MVEGDIDVITKLPLQACKAIFELVRRKRVIFFEMFTHIMTHHPPKKHTPIDDLHKHKSLPMHGDRL